MTKPGFKLTPVMQQYLDLKRGHEDALLFFRMGDFYELFFEDAEEAAKLLDIRLTSRNRNDSQPIPMCGVPYHSVRPYIARLLEAGVKVAICEQLELPEHGIARRAIVRVVTPGTALDEDTLAPERANYLASVSEQAGVWGLAWVEFSTGEVRVTEAPAIAALVDELELIAPSEVVVGGGGAEQLESQLALSLPACVLSRAPAADSDGYVAAADYVGRAAHAAGPVGSALRDLVAYVHVTQGGYIAHLRAPVSYEAGSFLKLDGATRRNLEIVESVEGKRSGSLLSVLDSAVTPMGKRLTREWLARPLADAAAIGGRLDAVEQLLEDFSRRSDVREILADVGDLERVVGRLGANSATARDLVRLATALEAVDRLRRALIGDETATLINTATLGLDDDREMRELIGRAVVDEPPLAAGRGRLIREGYHAEVDRLRGVSSDGKGWMAAFEASERKRTGVANLKIGYNKVFGYFIEVSRAAQHKVPDEYQRKQTLSNAERYITDELKSREAEVLGAEERLGSLEAHLLEELLAIAGKRLGSLARTAASAALIDTLCGFAETAHRAKHCRPEISADGVLDIVEGRHPVVEAAIGSSFIPNDCRLSPQGELVLVITGPNMAGKSTYLRQVALITLMAHCGAFVPATSARIPLVDRIFTRIGASDNLARGRSTFMVEMTETANILVNMTENSLVVLDEIGRGTSTFDGISIAWAVAEAMVSAGVKTLFATHYHELAGLAAEHEAVANYSVAVRRYQGEIIFLYRVAAGAASGSYGIEVAKLAGVPAGVIDGARRMLEKFESGRSMAGAVNEQQPSLFGYAARVAEAATASSVLEQELASLDVEALTPLESLTILDRLVRKAKKGQ